MTKKEADFILRRFKTNVRKYEAGYGFLGFITTAGDLHRFSGRLRCWRSQDSGGFISPPRMIKSYKEAMKFLRELEINVFTQRLLGSKAFNRGWKKMTRKLDD